MRKKRKKIEAEKSIHLLRRTSRMNNGDDCVATWIAQRWAEFSPQAESAEGQIFLAENPTLTRQVSLARVKLRQARRTRRGNRARAVA
jgi:hypothetical protein